MQASAYVVIGFVPMFNTEPPPLLQNYSSLGWRPRGVNTRVSQLDVDYLAMRVETLGYNRAFDGVDNDHICFSQI